MKPVKFKYLQLELGAFPNWRELKTLKEAYDWYTHLVTNPRRTIKYKLVKRFPKSIENRPEYCVIEMNTGRFLSKRELLKGIKNL